jgi:hypothetical protein
VFYIQSVGEPQKKNGMGNVLYREESLKTSEQKKKETEEQNLSQTRPLSFHSFLNLGGGCTSNNPPVFRQFLHGDPF